MSLANWPSLTTCQSLNTRHCFFTVGLPGSRQCEHQPLKALLSPAFLARHPPQAPLADGPAAVAPRTLPDDANEELLQQFKAMGYLGADGADK